MPALTGKLTELNGGGKTMKVPDVFNEETTRFIDEQFGFLNKQIAFCNYGSFGVVPKDVLDVQFKYMREVESDPDLWMRSTSINLWLANREAIATRYFSTRPENMAFVINTTSAVNAVLSSINWERGDTIIITNWTFSTVRIICEDLVNRHETGFLNIYTIQIPYPIPNDDYLVGAFVEAADRVAESGRIPRIAIVDVISSQPAVFFPYIEIVHHLALKGVLTLVDGAQAPGQVDINLDSLGADFFAGTALLYVAPKHQAIIRAPVVSMSGCLLSRGCRLDDLMATHFFWQGTSNNTSFACVTKAIEFIDRIGGLSKIREFNQKLNDMAIPAILSDCQPNAQAFKVPSCLVAPFMRNIIVTVPDLSNESVEFVQRELYERHSVWTAVSGFKAPKQPDGGTDISSTTDNGTRILFRISAQVCNTVDDYHRLATAINQFVKEGFVATTLNYVSK